MSAEELALAEEAATRGDRQAVVDAWRRADPSDERHAYFFALLLLEVGALEEARAARARVDASDLLQRLDRLLRESELESAPVAAGEVSDGTGEDPWEVELRSGPSAPADAALVEAFLRWFGGRRDLYARQWYDERRRRGGYRPIREPLDPGVVRQHLAGRITIGQYLLHADGTCSYGVIDLDLSASAMAALRAAHGDDVSPARHAGLREHARRLMEGARRLGLRLFAEDSGGRGVHLWLFASPRRPARALRAVLGQIVAAAPAAPPDVGVELFPKQDRLGPRGLSSLVKLPLGVHLGTLRRCPLLDDTLQPIQDSVAAIDRLEVSPPDALGAVAGYQVAPLPAPELVPVEPLPALPEQSTPRLLSEALRAIADPEAQRDAIDRILERCHLLEALVRRALEERRLVPAEARALAYTLGLIGPGNTLIREIFVAAGASHKILEQISRGRPSPMGCMRLRRLCPQGADRCACFPEGARPYPTPALHAITEVAAGPARPGPFAPWLQEESSIVRDPLQEIGERLRRIEDRLDHLVGVRASEGTGVGTTAGADDASPEERGA